MVDQLKLEALRKKFGGNQSAEIYNPRFREVAGELMKGSARKKPYGGLPTLLDAPAKELSADLDIALIGVPMDLGVTNRPGARFGPRAMRSIERVGPYHAELDVTPSAILNIADIGDVEFQSRFSLEQSIDDIEHFYEGVISQGVRPLSVGGDHSVTYPIMKALGANEAFGMIHIDAHADTAGEFEDTKFQHGAPFRHAVLCGALDPERSIQIGIRGSAGFLWEFSYDSGMTVITMEEFMQMGVDAVIKKALEVVGDKPFYITLDVDAFDPTFAPGTGTPEVGGLAPVDVQLLLRGLRGGHIIGGDVVEVAPQYDTNTTTVLLGAQMLFEILSLMALDPTLAGKKPAS